MDSINFNCDKIGLYSASKLRNLSHAENGVWNKITNNCLASLILLGFLSSVNKNRFSKLSANFLCFKVFSELNYVFKVFHK